MVVNRKGEYQPVASSVERLPQDLCAAYVLSISNVAIVRQFRN